MLPAVSKDVWPTFLRIMFIERILLLRFVSYLPFIPNNTVEPLNKGHFRTDRIVPYTEVVLHWNVLRKK